MLSKAYADGSATDDQRTELFELLKSEMTDDDDDDDVGDDEGMNKGFVNAALEDPAIEAGHVDADGVDVSGYLARISAFVGGSLDTINGDMHKSMDRLHSFNYAQAKANQGLARLVVNANRTIRAQGELIKSLGGRVETIEETPQQRRTVPTAKALEKSLTTPGSPSEQLGGAELTRDEMTKGFGALMAKSMTADYGGERYKAPCGRDITTDTAHYESHTEVHPDMLGDPSQLTI
jgi:hypothetical protein